MFSEKSQLINRIAQILQKNNKCSNDKNMISETALVFWCLSKLQTRLEFLAKNLSHNLTEKTQTERVFPKSFKSDILLIATTEFYDI